MNIIFGISKIVDCLHVPLTTVSQSHTYTLIKTDYSLLTFKVGWKHNGGKLHCLCTHLSAFGGNIFVAPNPIDFDKVWTEFKRLGETGNFVVLSTVCFIFGLYFIGLVVSRRADKKDLRKVHSSNVLRCLRV